MALQWAQKKGKFALKHAATRFYIQTSHKHGLKFTSDDRSTLHRAFPSKHESEHCTSTNTYQTGHRSLILSLTSSSFCLLHTRVERAQCLTTTLSIRMRAFARFCQGLHSSWFGFFSRCSRLRGIALLHFIIRIMGIVSIVCSTTNNKCLKHLNLTTQQTLAYTIPFNHIGGIELLHTLTHRQVVLI